MDFPPLPDGVAERTVPELLAAAVADAPDRTALIAHSLLAGREVRLSFGDLAARVATVAGILQRRGVAKGDRVVILLRNTAAADAHVAYHAAHRLGAIAVPVNTLYVRRELAYVLRFTTPAAVIVEPDFVEMVSDGLAPGGDTVVLEVGPAGAVGESLTALLESEPEAAVPATVSESDEADWVFTSGTTGHPKAVAFTHGAAVACGYEAIPLWDIDAASVYQNSAPFFTSTGCHTNQLACLAARCTQVVDPEVDIRAIVDRAVRLDTTHMFLLTPLIAMLLRQLDDGRLATLDLGHVKHINYGGQVMPRAFHERVERLFTLERGIKLAGVYGLTEGGTSGLTFPPERHAEAVKRTGPYGLPFGDRPWNEWVQFKIVDEHDVEVPPGTVGQMLLRAPSVMARYVDNAEATEQALRGGWLHTRDMVMQDDAGFVFFVDRDSLMIRRGGMNISSVEVEGLAAEHPAVEEAAAVPRPNPVLGEDVHLVVALRADAEATDVELIEYLRSGLADYKVPRSVSFVDALPRTAMGRVARAELKDMVAEQTTAASRS
jgi:acyl-CoA synthetase (AMP-forming)/AMP-acid ligase II